MWILACLLLEDRGEERTMKVCSQVKRWWFLSQILVLLLNCSWRWRWFTHTYLQLHSSTCMMVSIVRWSVFCVHMWIAIKMCLIYCSAHVIQVIKVCVKHKMSIPWGVWVLVIHDFLLSSLKSFFGFYLKKISELIKK